ncbi:TRAP transporter large permease [Paracoccus spongiarum]|uniref:TRAP transporter large permease subunit n=1 Tax=Paracoccus spongiarum TaxID=3064387 RepID=A0ABT9JDF4_9RHOB|nr:TRAP transporter large permease subunit [Paracoccus sp. 2205BS29-5]MDP5307142.1 TRAP transporter large permease subunit [Paracoccus sp. 2205BS29-5]
MAPATIGLGGFLLALALVALRVPLAHALIALSAAGLLLLNATDGTDGALQQTGAQILEIMQGLVATEALAMVPLFVALGNIAFYSGITTRIYDAAAVWLRPLPGGLAVASVLGCGGFAAISGSSVGCASTMGRICVPEMRAAGYDPRLAAASVAAGGTLGGLIPPSVLFILFAVFSGIPVERLFMAGILPGLLSLAGMVGVIGWWVRQDPAAAPPAPQTGPGRAEAALAAWPALLVLAIIMGGIGTGLWDATGAAAISLALVVGLGLVQGRLAPDVLLRAARESLMQSAALVLVILGARLFLAFLTQSGLDAMVADGIAGAQVPVVVLLMVLVVLYLVLGLFLDPVTILVLTLPFMLPLVQGYGMDSIWFAVVIVKLLEIGMITPPVGLNVFVIGNVARDVGVDRIFSGVARFLGIDLLVLLVIVLVPALSTLIPSLMAAG